MSLIASIAAGISTLLAIALAIVLPAGVAALIGDKTDSLLLTLCAYAIGVALTFGTLLGVVYHYSP